MLPNGNIRPERVKKCSSIKYNPLIRYTVKLPYVDTSLKWPPPYCGHLSSTRAIFAGNEPLECGDLSILDCRHFFPVPSVVKNLLKVDSHPISRHFRHCLKSRKQKSRIQRFEKTRAREN